MIEPDLATVAADRLRERWEGFLPTTFIGMGSGLAVACRGLKAIDEVPFAEVPGFAAPTVVGHSGELRIGVWSDERVLVMLGRMHLYEGHSIERVVHPIRVAHRLGVKRIILTNMSGGMHADWPLPALALVEGNRDLQSGWRAGFEGDAAKPYSERLNRMLTESANEVGVTLKRGTYAGLLGPNYETPSEVRALQQLGCDLVGMSTVQEARIASELGLDCCAISCVANHAAGVTEREIDHADVVDAGALVAPQFVSLLDSFFRRISKERRT